MASDGEPGCLRRHVDIVAVCVILIVTAAGSFVSGVAQRAWNSEFHQNVVNRGVKELGEEIRSASEEMRREAQRQRDELHSEAGSVREDARELRDDARRVKDELRQELRELFHPNRPRFE